MPPKSRRFSENGDIIAVANLYRGERNWQGRHVISVCTFGDKRPESIQGSNGNVLPARVSS